MATNDTTQKTMTAKSSGDFQNAYIRLRTVLDSLEVLSLRYCLKDTDAALRIRRAKEIEALLMPVITKLKLQLKSKGCPDGLFDCDGCCVSYPCAQLFE